MKRVCQFVFVGITQALNPCLREAKSTFLSAKIVKNVTGYFLLRSHLKLKGPDLFLGSGVVGLAILFVLSFCIDS